MQWKNTRTRASLSSSSGHSCSQLCSARVSPPVSKNNIRLHSTQAPNKHQRESSKWHSDVLCLMLFKIQIIKGLQNEYYSQMFHANLTALRLNTNRKVIRFESKHRSCHLNRVKSECLQGRRQTFFTAEVNGKSLELPPTCWLDIFSEENTAPLSLPVFCLFLLFVSHCKTEVSSAASVAF